MSQVQSVTDLTFADEVEHRNGVVAVKFSADWCAACRVLAPVVEALASEYGPRLRVAHVDADESAAVTERFDIRGLPTIVLFRDGAEVDRIVGLRSKEALRERFETALEA